MLSPRSTSRRRPFLLLWLLPLLLLAAGCRRGPDGEKLHAELQARLDGQFQEGLFEVVRLARSGSYPFTGEDDRERLLVYYRVRLRFLQDYNLAEWNRLNAGALHTVLGAATEGISGISQDGNEAGDELEVHGTSTYLREEGSWVASTSRRAVRREEGKARSSAEQSPLEQSLVQLGERIRWLSNHRKQEHLEILERELERAFRTIDLRLDRLDERLSLVTAGPTSEYGAVGRGLEAAAEELGVRFRSYRSTGSAENCRLVEARLAEFGIVQNDTAALAKAGDPRFHAPRPYEHLRAVATLFPEAIHVVTRADSDLTSIDQLRGRTVSVGPPGSGTRVNAEAVLKAFDIEFSDLEEYESDNLQVTLAALESGELDAFFVTRAYPAPVIEELASEVRLRFLPIPREEAERLSEELPFFPRMVLPRHTYPGQEEDVKTLGVTAMMVTHVDTPDERVTAFLELLFARPDLLAKESTVAHFITPRTSRLGLSIELHPAARAFHEAKREATEEAPAKR